MASEEMISAINRVIILFSRTKIFSIFSRFIKWL